MDVQPPPPMQRAPSVSRNTLVEIVGYLGAAIAISATGVALSSSSKSVQTLFDAVVALALLAAGWAIDDDTDVLRRMKSVFWFLAVGGFAGFLAGIFGDNLNMEGRSLVVAVAGVTTLLGAALWWMSKRSLQAIALFVAGLVTVVALVFPDLNVVDFFIPPDFSGVALIVTAWGLLWFGLGWKGIVQPRRTAMVLGSIAAIYGPLVKLQFEGRGILAWEVASLMVAALALVVGDRIGERAPSGIGIAGVLLVSSVIVSDQVKDQGAAIVVIVVGVALLALAIAAVRGLFGPMRSGSATAPGDAPPTPPVPPMEPPAES